MKSDSKNANVIAKTLGDINWRLWLGMDKVNASHAIGLTIPIHPDQVKVKFSRNKFHTKLENVNQQEAEEFELRTQQFLSNVTFRHFDDFTDQVIFPEFIAWVNTHTDWVMPPELVEFSAKLKFETEQSSPKLASKNHKWTDGEKIQISERMGRGETSGRLADELAVSDSRVRQLAAEGRELAHQREIQVIKNTNPEKKGWKS